MSFLIVGIVEILGEGVFLGKIKNGRRRRRWSMKVMLVIYFKIVEGGVF